MDKRLREQYLVTGQVQGVGFRPFVYRLATKLSLAGFVRNTHSGVLIEVEGNREAVQSFAALLTTSPPHGAVIESTSRECLPSRDEHSFTIGSSGGEVFDRTHIPIDTAPCAVCLLELADPYNRRYRYPFISCASCGPRFSIMRHLPFDRGHTSLDAFPLCSDCRGEYTNPHDRRFHAQTIGCPVCGPTVWFTDSQGTQVSSGSQAIADATAALSAGAIVAVKGVGGFHLLVDARSERSLFTLRDGKRRGNKPFAVLYRTIDDVARDCVISEDERRLILDNRGPIVFLLQQPETHLSELVAPGSPYIGAMLPCSPLHYLLMEEVRRPLVATSGNRGGEPICFENEEAVKQLNGLASFFLLHNRAIIHPCDDSIWQVVGDRVYPRRMGRGYAPYAIARCATQTEEGIALGGITKSAVAIGSEQGVIVGPYGGSVHSVSVMQRHESTIALLSCREGKSSGRTISDLHPDWVCPRVNNGGTSRVQHHLAHAWSAIIDGDLPLPVCAIVWDGAGYGPDGTIWGGEWLIITDEGYERRFYLKPFWLLGGDRAALLPERSAAALWLSAFGERARTLPVWERLAARDTLWRMIDTTIGCVSTTSMGRLFDGIASAVGLCHLNTFEGEAALRLEAAARNGGGAAYPLVAGDTPSIDWVPLIEGVEADLRTGIPTTDIAHRFHQTVIHLIGTTAEQIGIPRVVLTGGCFQNTLLLEGAIHTLRTRGFSPHWHHRIPCHDEGLSVGQLAAAKGERSRQRERSDLCV